MTWWGPLSVLALTLGANPYLDEGRSLYQSLRFQEAEAQLRLAQEVPTSTTAERREASDLLARSLAARGERREAEDVYARLLLADPEFPGLSDASPKILDAFLAAKRRVFPPDHVVLEELPVAPPALELKVLDPWQRVLQVTLHECVPGAGCAERPLPVEQGRATGTLSAPTQGTTVEWYVSAYGADGAQVAGLGTPDEPHRWSGLTPLSTRDGASLTVPPMAPVAPTVRERRLWSWTALAASTLAAGAGVYLIAKARSDHAQAGRAPLAGETLEGEAAAKRTLRSGQVLLGIGAGGGVGATLLFWHGQ